MKKKRKRSSKVWVLSKESFQILCHECETLSEILNRVGLISKGNNYKTLHERIEIEEVDVTHITDNPKRFTRRANLQGTAPDNEVFVKDSKWRIHNQQKIKKLFDNGTWTKYQCSLCGIEDWNSRKLVLQLDHVNGDSKDDRINNIRLLCPNCHSQTKTFAGRNIRTVDTFCAC